MDVPPSNQPEAFNFEALGEAKATPPPIIGRTRAASTRTPPDRTDQPKKARSDTEDDEDNIAATLEAIPPPDPYFRMTQPSMQDTTPLGVSPPPSNQIGNAPSRSNQVGSTQPSLPGDPDPMPLGLPPSIRRKFLPKPNDGWPDVHGMTLTRLLRGVKLEDIANWKMYEGFLILGVLANAPRNTHTAINVTAAEDIIRIVLPNSPQINVFPGGVSDEWLPLQYPFPVLIAGLTEQEADQLLHEGCLATAHRALFFYRFDTAFPMTPFAVTIENIALKGPANDARCAEEIKHFLKRTTEFRDHILAYNDNILFESPNMDLINWTINIVQIKSYIVQRSQGPYTEP
ncbi:hypothetical protein M422DRAFT_242696 [Sphaerobolus stellatus SS14]|nr:hypothetical protein M422DRAFT_242694 [Sphaerobolus stellatus SS14]KIJ52781.1 hypothetical protein M422DRAFT_242696 [Sphaerobolus stellatus SS14]